MADLPKDPMILLSVVNTKLRDFYADLDTLCQEMQIEKKESIYMIPKQLPVLFAAGAEDPVGGFGKGVRKVYEKYKAAGIQDISLRLYAGDRHELLNETDREQVYEDLLEWMEERRKINY